MVVLLLVMEIFKNCLPLQVPKNYATKAMRMEQRTPNTFITNNHEVAGMDHQLKCVAYPQLHIQ